MHPVLLLWDIDGTLLLSGGAGEESLRQVLLNEYGILDDLSDLEIAGRTDTSIIQDLCKKFQGHNIGPDEFLELYLRYLPLILKKKKGSVCPGVREMLEWSHAHPEVHNALLTGNVKRGAYLKLQHFGLDHFFEFGAFGDDSPDRNCLGPIVLERAKQHLKKDFHLKYTWVIGDTPRDIACARAVGCKVLAVATGRYSVEALKPYQPDLLVPNLLNYQEIVCQLESREE